MRAFVALFPPVEAVEDLSDFLAPRREVRTGSTGPMAPRWTRDEQLHLTLAFLPELADRDLEELTQLVAQAAGSRACGELRLAGGGAFPNAFDARVLWIGVEPQEARDELRRIAGRVRAAAGMAGARVEGGDFRAHVTVARMGRAQEASRWLRVLRTYEGPAWRPREIALVRSHLGQGPRRTPRYETLETFTLAQA